MSLGGRNRFPWVTLIVILIVLVALLEPDLEQGNWGALAFKLGGSLLLSIGVWGWFHWRGKV